MLTRWTVGRMLTAGFAIALVALGVVGASAYNRIGALTQAQQPLNRSHRTLGGIGKLGDLVNQVDRTQRAYVTAQSPTALQLYLDSARMLRRTLHELQRNTANDPVQQRILAQIGADIAVAVPDDASGAVNRDEEFDRITDLVGAAHDRETVLSEERLKAIDESAAHTKLLIIAVSLGTALFVAAAGRWITWRITSAAHEVTAAAGRVIEGDLTRPALVTRPAELAQMAHAVNSSMIAMAEARDEALAATAAKSAFLAAMSHEIRTPMNAVIGGTGLLDDGTLTPDQRELVQIVRGSADSLLVIINDILDFSKIEAGELVLDKRPVNLRGLIDDAVKLVALTADAKGLRLAVETTLDCAVTVVADETRLRQILVNLLGNAVKFTDHGTVSVSVSTSSLDGDEQRLKIDVHDTGIGIAEDQLRRLFVAFAQVDSSATRRRPGTGLGLVISRRLAEAMGGSLTVTSTPGEGSTFTVEAVVGVAGEAAAETRAPRLPVRRQHPLHILLAEDNPINQRVAELMLTRRGHTVDIVDNGSDAVRAVRAVAYDLVLMDVRMPVMDGLEATDRIRSEPPPFGTPRIVALTANATVDDQAAARRAGMDDFLAKPIQESDLDAVLAAAAPLADPSSAEVVAANAEAAEATGETEVKAARKLAVEHGAARATAEANAVAAKATTEADVATASEVLAAAQAEDDDIRKSIGVIAGADFANQVRLADILLAFARRLPDVLAELDQAVDEADHHKIDRLAHGLKGSAATLGAHRLAGACAALEAYAQRGDKAGAASALRELHERAEIAGRSVTTVSQELVAT